MKRNSTYFNIPDFIPETYIYRKKISEKIQSVQPYADMIFIEAKQGQGKTIAAAQYLSSLKCDKQWYKISSYDNDFVFFLNNFTAGIIDFFPDFKNHPLYKIINSQQIKSEDSNIYGDFINSFFKKSKLKQNFYIAFDDFHLIENSKTLINFFKSFLKEPTENLKIIIISRNSITSALENKINPDYLIDDKSLKIDFKEALEITEKLSLKEIPINTIKKIYELSQGWAFGFVSEIFNYSGDENHKILLKNQLLKSINKNEIKILIQLSLMESIDIEILKEIPGFVEVEETLENFYRKNPFFYKNKNGKYSFHHIFQEILQKETTNYFTNKEINFFYMELIKVMRSKNRIIHSIAYCVKAGKIELIEEILKENGPDLYSKNRITSAYSLLSNFKFNEVNKYPWILLFKGIALLEINPKLAIKYLRRSNELMKTTDNIGKLLSISEIIYFNLALTGDFAAVEKDMAQLLHLNESYRKDLPYYLDLRILQQIAFINILIFLDIDAALKHLEMAADVIKKIDNDNLKADLYIAYIFCHITKGDIKETIKYLNRLFPYLFSPVIGSQTKHLILFTILNTSAVDGDYFTYNFLKTNMNEFVERHLIKQSMTNAFLNIWDAAFHICAGNYKDAEIAVDKALVSETTSLAPHIRCRFYYYKAYILAINKNNDKAVKFLNKSREMAEISSSNWYKLTSKVLNSAVYNLIGDYKNAEIQIKIANKFETQTNGTRNLIGYYAHQAYILIKQNKDDNLNEILNKIGFYLSENNRLFCFSISKDMIIGISEKAVKNDIYQDNFKCWAIHYAKTGFNSKSEPVPLLELKTFGEFNFYIGENKVFSINELTPKELKIFDMLLSSKNKSVTTEDLSLFINDKEKIYSRSANNKINARLRKKIGDFIKPLDPGDYFSIEKGSVSFKNIHCDFDEVIDCINSGIKEYKNSNLWTASTHLRKALHLAENDFIRDSQALDLMTTFYQHKLLPQILKAAEIFAEIILKTGIVTENDLTLLEKIIEKDYSNTSLVTLIYRIYIKNSEIKKSIKLIQKYNDILIQDELSDDEIQEYMDYIFEEIN